MEPIDIRGTWHAKEHIHAPNLQTERRARKDLIKFCPSGVGANSLERTEHNLSKTIARDLARIVRVGL